MVRSDRVRCARRSRCTDTPRLLEHLRYADTRSSRTGCNCASTTGRSCRLPARRWRPNMPRSTGPDGLHGMRAPTLPRPQISRNGRGPTVDRLFRGAPCPSPPIASSGRVILPSDAVRFSASGPRICEITTGIPPARRGDRAQSNSLPEGDPNGTRFTPGALRRRTQGPLFR